MPWTASFPARLRSGCGALWRGPASLATHPNSTSGTQLIDDAACSVAVGTTSQPYGSCPCCCASCVAPPQSVATLCALLVTRKRKKSCSTSTLPRALQECTVSTIGGDCPHCAHINIRVCGIEKQPGHLCICLCGRPIIVASPTHHFKCDMG